MRRFPPSLASFLSALFLMGNSMPLKAADSAHVDFTKEVQPIFAEHCFKCHGQDEGMRKGGLRLDVRDAALKGGKHDGAALVAGKPDGSAVIARITSHEDDEMMPPPKEKKP